VARRGRPAKRREAVPPGLPRPPDARPDRRCDVLVVGAGAAGLLAALAARGALQADGTAQAPPPGSPDVVLLNNEARLGLKLLVSGGGRCNVTNAEVDEHDYVSDAPHLVRRLLKGFPAASTRALFESRGCPLYAEPLGKLFPRSDDARQVLRVLLDAVVAAEIPLLAPVEATGLIPPAEDDAPWTVGVRDGEPWRADRVVLATGGKSLPKTGSRGFGLEALARLGHEVAAPLPALTPLVFGPDSPLRGLAGLTTPAVLTLAPASATPDQLAGKKLKPLARAAGSLLVTHQGATGPAPFDVSGPAGRARKDGPAATLYGDFWSLHQPDGPWAPFLGLDKAPGASLRPRQAPRPPSRAEFDAQVAPLLADRGRPLGQALAARLPKSLVGGLLAAEGLEPTQPIKRLEPRDRGALWRALTQADLRYEGCAGYAKAEVTVGGVLLGELSPKTLESRRHPRLFCCGEVVNVTGRLGGFNFQWAWSSGFVAGRGAATA
jgi:predicted Rossmann fold flavoprotein